MKRRGRSQVKMIAGPRNQNYYQGIIDLGRPQGGFCVLRRVASPSRTLPKDSKGLRPAPISPCNTDATRESADVRGAFVSDGACYPLRPEPS